MLEDRMQALERRLQRAEDELAVRNLIARYGMAVDCGDVQAALDCHLLHTGHLSDRELYQALWDDVVGELIPKREMLLGERLIQVVDFIADGSLESLRLYLKHYADEKARRIWAEKWPEDILPASEPAPYDRDEYLPAIDLRPSIKG